MPIESQTDTNLQLPITANPPPSPTPKPWTWWLIAGLNTFLVLTGQSAGTLLAKFYYNQGGDSKWLQSLTLSAAFPILYLPLLLLPSPPPSTSPSATPTVYIALVYVVLGLLSAADSFMYSYGLLYLSVSTYSLVCATQLAFNAIFSYFINSENFTHLTLNSAVLLTLSSAIVGLRSDNDGPAKGGNFVIGFVVTISASALYSLILSLMELAFEKKMLKSQAFAAVLYMQIYTSIVATVATAVGLFASGEWRGLKEEMEGFRKGRVVYVMTLVWTAVAWQVSSVGVVGLVFEVSSLFSNVISTLGIPLAPVLAVILLHERMDGIKVVAFLLAMWGFVSYFYQHYIDYKSEKRLKMAREEIETHAA